MYERFTDRARKVMQLANQEAQRLNHEYVGTEHILLGLVKDGSAVAAHFLKGLDVNLRTLRSEVEGLTQSGPDTARMGRLPLTPRATQVIAHSAEEAASLNNNYIGSEHLLLGLLREEDGRAARVLMNLGFRLKRLREEFLLHLDFGLESIGAVGRRLLGPPPKAGSVGQRSREHPARRLGRWVRQHEFALIFLGGVLAPLIGAAFTALVQALPNPGVGGLIAGVVYVSIVLGMCLAATYLRSSGPAAPNSNSPRKTT